MQYRYPHISIVVLPIAMIVLAALSSYAQTAPGILGKEVNMKGEDEYAPYMIHGRGGEDTLFFTSSRAVQGERRRALQSRIFFATRPASKRSGPITEGWSTAKLLSSVDPKFSSFTQGATVVTEDRIIFAADRNLSNLGTSAQLELWEMVRVGATFSKPVPISEVNDPNAWDSQPALSEDGRTLFFVSNRRGGKGARDIWYSTLGEDGRWSRPQPVPNVNTPGDEFSPFHGPDGRFYFSTNWDFVAQQVGSRKKEIHRAELGWQNNAPVPANPMNLDDAIRQDAGQYDIGLANDFRINSDEDDEFPFITPDRKAIFLSSGRKGGFGGQDIYAFALPSARIRLQVRVIEQLVDSSGAPMTMKREVNYPIEVRDEGTRDGARSIGENLWLLEPERNYAVSLTGISPDDCFDVQVYNTPTFTVRSSLPYAADTLITREFLVTRRRISVPQIVFQATETLPYFITGYWWPNTNENLRRFDERKEAGFFEESGFIQRDDYDYDAVAQQISTIFEERLYAPMERLLPRFTARCADTLALVVTVHGYTDPRRLRPPHNYPDETVTVGTDLNGLPVTIVSGSEMIAHSWPLDPGSSGGQQIRLKDRGQQGNILLSKLRAYYTFRTLDTMMKQRSREYARLAREGRVILDAEGYGKYRDDVPDDDPMSRRIEIYLDAVPLSQVAEFKRMRGGAIVAPVQTVDIPVDDEQPVVEEKPENDTKVASKENDIVDHTITSPTTTVNTQAAQRCYAIQFCSILDEAEASRKVQLLIEQGVENARVEPFRDRKGQMLYRVRSGCYTTADEASEALSDYDWAYDMLSLPSRPVIVR
jgi:hypothetical protein